MDILAVVAFVILAFIVGIALNGAFVMLIVAGFGHHISFVHAAMAGGGIAGLIGSGVYGGVTAGK